MEAQNAAKDLEESLENSYSSENKNKEIKIAKKKKISKNTNENLKNSEEFSVREMKEKSSVNGKGMARSSSEYSGETSHPGEEVIWNYGKKKEKKKKGTISKNFEEYFENIPENFETKKSSSQREAKEKNNFPFIEKIQENFPSDEIHKLEVIFNV